MAPFPELATEIPGIKINIYREDENDSKYGHRGKGICSKCESEWTSSCTKQAIDREYHQWIKNKTDKCKVITNEEAVADDILWHKRKSDYGGDWGDQNPTDQRTRKTYVRYGEYT